tara:strand:+ start:408 stop:791 length:384 start_codon:yes stop_codon:yes gene_type:complete
MNETDITDLQVQAPSPIVGIVLLAIFLVCLIGAWKVFTKAGQPGWGILIPIYNLYLLCKIGGKPGWWWILLCIPFVGIIFAILVCLGIAQNFGKGAGYGIGLAFLGFIFLPALGFGSAKYVGSGAAA